MGRARCARALSANGRFAARDRRAALAARPTIDGSNTRPRRGAHHERRRKARPQCCRLSRSRGAPTRRAHRQLPRTRRRERPRRRTSHRPGHRAEGSGRDHAAQRPAVRGRLLRRAPRGLRRSADEPAAQGARGCLLPRRLGRVGDLRLARRGRRGRGRGAGTGRRGDPGRPGYVRRSTRHGGSGARGR
jgi:hypothetical protein